MGNRISKGASIVLALVMQVTGTVGAAKASDALRCERAAGLSLAKCAKKVAGIQRDCFRKGGGICDHADPEIVAALSKLTSKVTKKCVDDATVQSTGYPALTLTALLDRLEASCLAETESLVARVYGGPHGAAWAGADDDGKKCIDTLMKTGRKVLFGTAKARMKCVNKQRKKGNCDLTKTNAKVTKLETKAIAKIDKKCSDQAPETLVTLTSSQFIERATEQGECMTAIAHPDVTPLSLDCGPRTAVPAPPRGSYTQVVLDHATWGTRCGDGSDYAFQIRLAPEGHPVENVVVQMQGGGVCIFPAQCASVGANLFEALSDGPETKGIMSNDELVNPFANWTKLYLPYCTQDVFIGGGTTEDFTGTGGPVIERYGAINVRAALRYLRDVLWRELDEDSEGYRNDRINMLFGGTSAGGFGTLYNYHYVLDDLQWIHSTAWPDAALGLDSGGVVSIVNLGAIAIPAWGSGPYLPPYCFGSTCAEGEKVYATAAPRLKREPRQQFLVLSNQVDSTQVSTTFFPNSPSWINKMRQSYCDTAGTNGLHYFLTPITTSTHVIATKEALFTGSSPAESVVDGIVMRDWLANAVTDPDNVPDAVAEGTLATSISGVNPFPCTVD